MTTASDIQALLRFLTQSASVPLAKALSFIPKLQQANLTTIALIASHPLAEIRTLLFPDDEKAAKQLHNAAKRASGGGKTTGKRERDTGAGAESVNTSTVVGRKKRRRSFSDAEPSAAEIEADLALPLPYTMDEEVLKTTVLVTNRAPLLLAFAVTLLKYTMPEQPLSSRLSLAQAMVSTGARARAYNLGIEKTVDAEQEGWGKGQPVVRVVGREVKVLRRWAYDVAESQALQPGGEEVPPLNTEGTTGVDNKKTEEGAQNETVLLPNNAVPTEPPLWGLDLEALKKFNAPPLVNAPSHNTNGLPIHRPESARAYLLKSFVTASNDDATQAARKPKKIAEEKERNLGLLLGALDLLYQSWTPVLTADELDRRAWSWYVNVRPEVENGAAGWGGKNVVKLSQILDLRRQV